MENKIEKMTDILSSQKTLYINYAKCIGCETCEAVCKLLYNIPRIMMIRTCDGQMLPLYCRHCSEPNCIKVCPRNALIKDKNGVILLDSMNCRGCETKNCILGCPHAGIFATSEGVAISKCDLCAARRKEDMLPACVEMCPCGAILYINRDEIEKYEDEEAKVARARVLSHVRPAKARK